MIDVSIIIPIYNRAKTLNACIESVLQLDYSNYEVVLVDDGSTDESASICKDFCKRYANISYFYKENGGVSSARNLGLSKSNGKWVTFVDSDDLVSPSHLNIISREVKKDIDWLIQSFCGSIDQANNFFRKSEIKRVVPDNPAIYYFTDFLKTDTPVYSVWGKFYKREICNKYHIRFREDVHLSEDQIFNLEYLKYVTKLVHYPDARTYIQTDLIIEGNGGRLSSKVHPLDEYYNFILSNYKAVRNLDEEARGVNIPFGVDKLVYYFVTLTLVNYQRRKYRKKLQSGELLSFTRNKIRPIFKSVLSYKNCIILNWIKIPYLLIVGNHCRLALYFCQLYCLYKSLCSRLIK